MHEYYDVRVDDATGVGLIQFNNFGSSEGAGLDYVLNVGQPSALTLTIPRSWVDPSYFRLDGRISVWRGVGNYGPFQEGDATYLIRKWRRANRSLTITAYHANLLSSRRIVAYDKTTTFSDKAAAAADNTAKTIWKENAGASISGADRDGAEEQADISAYVSTQANTTQGASIAVQAGRRVISEVFQELVDASTQAGTYLAVEVIGPPNSLMELRTYTTARGKDRRSTTTTGGVPIILSEEAGTLVNAELIEDYTDEKTAIIAVGAGDDDLRLVQVAVDATRLAATPLNRIEAVIDLSNIDDDVQLLNAAKAELQRHRPLIYFTGEIPQASPLIRGVDYDYGDIIQAEFEGVRYDCRLDSIRVSLGHDSRTTQVILRSI